MVEADGASLRTLCGPFLPPDFPVNRFYSRLPPDFSISLIRVARSHNSRCSKVWRYRHRTQSAKFCGAAVLFVLLSCHACHFFLEHANAVFVLATIQQFLSLRPKYCMYIYIYIYYWYIYIHMSRYVHTQSTTGPRNTLSSTTAGTVYSTHEQGKGGRVCHESSEVEYRSTIV